MSLEQMQVKHEVVLEEEEERDLTLEREEYRQNDFQPMENFRSEVFHLKVHSQLMERDQKGLRELEDLEEVDWIAHLLKNQST